MHLLRYEDVGWPPQGYLLLGNGFSISLYDTFKFDSLYAVADLGPEEQRLFAHFHTQNFEQVLEKLAGGRDLCSLVGLDPTAISAPYERIKEALMRAVCAVHPAGKREVCARVGPGVFDRLANLLACYQGIFTTNYDLLLYWARMRHPDRFVDFFFHADGHFDPANTELWAGHIGVYNLHGSLYIFREGNLTRKIRANPGRHMSLMEALGSLTQTRSPVFVSEGTAVDKRKTIASNDYLTFCWQQLHQMNGLLTILGFSCSENDSHIAAAIKESQVQTVAYGVHVGDKSPQGIQAEIDRIQTLLSPKHCLFFDAATLSHHYLRRAFWRDHPLWRLGSHAQRREG